METRDPGVDTVDPSVDMITPLEKPQQDLDLYQEWEDIINAPEIEVGKAEDEQKAIAEREMQETIARAEAEQRAEIDRQDRAREAEQAEQAAADRAAQEAAVKAEIDRENRTREAEQASADRAAKSRQAAQQATRGGVGRNGGFSGAGAGTGASGPPGRNYAKGGLIRKQYSSGGIVDLLK